MSLTPKTGVLGRRLAAHLLRRTTYNITKARIDDFATKTVTQALDALMTIPPLQNIEPIATDTGLPWINCGAVPNSCPTTTSLNGGPQRDLVTNWWKNEAVKDTSLSHKVQFFLHTCMTVSKRYGSSAQFFDHLALLRYSVLGSYRVFVLKMTMDGIMLDYLDNKDNVAGNPNENYARELFELFTIGKGDQIAPGDYTNYTETDIQEAARVLTGFKEDNGRITYIDPDTGIPRGYPKFSKHDAGDKTFSAAFGNAVITGAADETDMYRELEDFINMIFAQEETANYLVRRIYRHFVAYKIDANVEANVIVPLANSFRSSDYNLEVVFRELFSSQYFYDEADANATDNIIGSLIVSPLDMTLQTVTRLGFTIPDMNVEMTDFYTFYSRINSRIFAKVDFQLFDPPTVAGYPAYYQVPDYNRLWFNSSTIIGRYSVPSQLMRIQNNMVNSTIFDFVDWVENTISIPSQAEYVVTEILELFFTEKEAADRYDYFLNTIFLDNLPADDWTYEWADYLVSGNKTEVDLILKRFLEAVLSSQEFQLS